MFIDCSLLYLQLALFSLLGVMQKVKEQLRAKCPSSYVMLTSYICMF